MFYLGHDLAALRIASFREVDSRQHRGYCGPDRRLSEMDTYDVVNLNCIAESTLVLTTAYSAKEARQKLSTIGGGNLPTCVRIRTRTVLGRREIHPPIVQDGILPG